MNLPTHLEATFVHSMAASVLLVATSTLLEAASEVPDSATQMYLMAVLRQQFIPLELEVVV